MCAVHRRRRSHLGNPGPGRAPTAGARSPRMRTLVSRLDRSGFLVIARLPNGAAIAGTFADDGTTRDLTAHAANLVLSGALDRVEASASGRPDPREEVDAVSVRYLEPATMPGEMREAASFTWANPGNGQSGDFQPGEVLPLLARGLNVELTAAVAAESGHVTQDDIESLLEPASELENEPGAVDGGASGTSR